MLSLHRAPSTWQAIVAVVQHEWRSYWSTALPFLFIAVFLVMVGAFTFYLGQFFERNQADLNAMTKYMPWLLMVMVPALAMRSWAEDRQLGTLEFLMSLPVSSGAMILGKFFGALAVIVCALFPTVTFWITVSYLGDPDHGAIATGYLGIILTACSFLAISQLISALNTNQTIAFVLSTAVCFLLTVTGTPIITNAFEGWLPLQVVDFIASLSVLRHFQPMLEGAIILADVVFFLGLTALGLVWTYFVVERYRQ